MSDVTNINFEHTHIKVQIKGHKAIISGVVSREEQKRQVSRAIETLDGVSDVRNYLCVIAPFKPLSKLFPNNNGDKETDEPCDTLITVMHFRNHPDDLGHVIYHDTLTRAQEFFKHNPGYVLSK